MSQLSRFSLVLISLAFTAAANADIITHDITAYNNTQGVKTTGTVRNTAATGDYGSAYTRRTSWGSSLQITSDLFGNSSLSDIATISYATKVVNSTTGTINSTYPGGIVNAYYQSGSFFGIPVYGKYLTLTESGNGYYRDYMSSAPAAYGDDWTVWTMDVADHFSTTSNSNKSSNIQPADYGAYMDSDIAYLQLSTNTSTNWNGLDVYWDWMEVSLTSGDVYRINFNHVDGQPAATPEPASILILGVGLCGLPLCRRLRRKAA